VLFTVSIQYTLISLLTCQCNCAPGYFYGSRLTRLDLRCFILLTWQWQAFHYLFDRSILKMGEKRRLMVTHPGIKNAKRCWISVSHWGNWFVLLKYRIWNEKSLDKENQKADIFCRTSKIYLPFGSPYQVDPQNLNISAFWFSLSSWPTELIYNDCWNPPRDEKSRPFNCGDPWKLNPSSIGLSLQHTATKPRSGLFVYVNSTV
jgi:hypothetical protein